MKTTYPITQTRKSDGHTKKMSAAGFCYMERKTQEQLEYLEAKGTLETECYIYTYEK